MLLTHPTQVDSVEVPARTRGSFVLAGKSGLYILLILATAISAGGYGLRKYGIFGCSAAGYGSDSYLGYCGTTSYGDYDHGAFWYGLEPAATAAAAKARVLFVGNSRTVFAFSGKPTADWFARLSESYYLLGFSHFENYTFEAPLLRKLHPQAKVYIINIDSFFEQAETGPGKTVMEEDSARARYDQKRHWQTIHKAVCSTFRSACGHNWAIFRLRTTGAWHVSGGHFTSKQVSYDDDVDRNMVNTYTALGRQLLPTLSPGPECTILTIVPTVKTKIGTANVIASALHLRLVAPRVDGLTTFDQVHLDSDSARIWSAAFLEEAGPQIRNCLNR